MNGRDIVSELVARITTLEKQVSRLRTLQDSGVPSTWVWYTITFSVAQTVSTTVAALRNSAPGTLTIDHVRAEVSGAPTGNPIKVDIHKNGVTIFTVQADRPTIAAGTYAASGTPAVTGLVLNDYLTMQVDEVGTIMPGEDLTVHVRCKQYTQT